MAAPVASAGSGPLGFANAPTVTGGTADGGRFTKYFNDLAEVHSFSASTYVQWSTDYIYDGYLQASLNDSAWIDINDGSPASPVKGSYSVDQDDYRLIRGDNTLVIRACSDTAAHIASWGGDCSPETEIHFNFDLAYSPGDCTDPAQRGIGTCDFTAPDAPVFNSTPDAITQSTTADFNLGNVEAGGTINCTLDSNPTDACAEGDFSIFDLTPGAHNLSVTVTDGNSNVSTPASYDWNVISTTAPTLDSGTSPVNKGDTIKSSGWALDGLPAGDLSTTFAWQRCTALDTPADCQQINREGGTTGAWWGTRNPDVGNQVRVMVTWWYLGATVASVTSDLSGVIKPVSTSAPTLDLGANPVPVVGAPARTSFGVWKGWVAGSSTAEFQWQSCSSPTDELTCSDLDGRGSGQWYRPVAADEGSYLRVRARVETNGQSATAFSAISGEVQATAPISRRARAAVNRHRHGIRGRHPASSGKHRSAPGQRRTHRH